MKALAAAPCCGARQIMKHAILWSLTFTMCFAALQAAPQDSSPPMPRYGGEKPIPPGKNRERVLLFSRLGMKHKPPPRNPQRFSKGFGPQWAYPPFLAPGNSTR